MNNRLERILCGMDKQEIATPQGLDDVLSEIFPGLNEKLSEKGNIKVTIEGWENQPDILENVNEFVLIARVGKDLFFKSRASISFRMAAIKEVRESIVKNL